MFKMDNQQEIRQDDIFRRIYGALIKNWILIVIIIAVITVAGVAFSFVRAPKYTATTKASFSVSNETNSTYNNNALTNNFIDSMLDFCDEGYVIDRANYYYDSYVKGNFSHVDQFITDVEGGRVCDEYVRGEYDGVEHIVAENLSVKSESTDEERIYGFSVSYTDNENDIANDKARIILLAISDEAKVPGEEAGTSHYFYLSKVVIGQSGQATAKPDMSKKTIVLVFLLSGIAVSLLVVYIKGLFDHSVRNQEELEQITGVNLLAYIDDTEGGR